MGNCHPEGALSINIPQLSIASVLTLANHVWHCNIVQASGQYKNGLELDTVAVIVVW